MVLTGIEIYKFLPKTNCKKCSFPTCLAFAMKVAQKTVDIATCPDLSEESKQALEAAGRPPIRLVTIGSDGKKIEVGNEVVMFRHEKAFLHPPGLMVRIKDTAPADSVAQQVAEVADFKVERVGMELALDGFAIENESGDSATFAQCVEAVKSKTDLPLVLMSSKAEAMAAALEKAASSKPLIYAATKDNWEPMAELAQKHGCPLAVAEPQGLSELAALVEEVNKKGVEDIVLDPVARDLASSLNTLTQLRRLALKKNFQSLGYPIITFPGNDAADVEEEALLAAQQVAKYAGVIVLDHFSPALAYPLLTLRLNIYTDPQKPIQVQPGVYPIGAPKDSSPLCVTTNFSLTYFSIAGELEASGHASWLLVCDTEGLSVLTAWAAGKFDAEKIAKSVKEFNAGSNINHQSVIIPGRVAVLRGEIEEELPDWKIMVGPPEAMDIGGYLKNQWSN
ncbi:MAG: acetyl-CoA decarbonylase/synthase complex subunit gamma [Dehalococcoidia bacterium]